MTITAMNDLDHPPGLLGEIVILDDVGPIRRRRGHPLLRAAVAPLLVVAGLLVGLLVLLPTLLTVVRAFTMEGGLARWSDAAPPVWVHEGFWPAWLRTLLWAAAVPAAVTASGVFLAWHLPRSPGRLLGALLVAPVAVPLVVTGVTFRHLYHPDPDRGVATYLFGAIPGDSGWLGPRYITLALVLAFAWAWLGLVTIVVRGALDQVPPGVEDAVRMAGHRGWRLFHDAFWRPAVARVAALLFLLMAVMSVRILDLILVMTPGSVLGDASVFSVLHLQSSGGETTGSSAALGTLWLGAAGVVLALTLLLRPRWPAPSPPPAPAPAAAAASATRHDDRDGWTVRRTVWPPRVPVVARDEHDMRRSLRPQALVAPSVAFVWAVPLLVLALVALHPPDVAATRGWWSRPMGLGSWSELGALRFWPSFWTTAGLTVAVSVAAVGVAILAVEALARMSERAARAVVLVMVAAAVVPVQVIAGSVNDVFGTVDRASPIDLTDTARLGLVHLALAVPLCVVVLYATRSQAFAVIRRVARDDRRRRPGPLGGARAVAEQVWDGLRKVARNEPAVVAAFVFVFLQVWNDFVVGLFFSGRDAVPLGLLLFGQTRQFVVNSGPVAAGSLVMLAVPLALIVVAHGSVAKGLIGGRLTGTGR